MVIHHLGFHARNIQDSIDGADQPVTLIPNDHQQFFPAFRRAPEGSLDQHAGCRLDRGQGRPQFVGYVADEIQLHGIQLLEPFAHGVEVRRQFLDLRRRSDAGYPVKSSTGYFFCLLPQKGDGTSNIPRNEKGNDDPKQNGQPCSDHGHPCGAKADSARQGQLSVSFRTRFSDEFTQLFFDFADKAILFLRVLPSRKGFTSCDELHFLFKQ